MVATYFLTLFFVYAWDYSQGGADWPGFCQIGKSQSPVNIQSDQAERISSENPKNLVAEFQFRELNIESYKQYGVYRLIGEYGTMTLLNNYSPVVTATIANLHLHSPSENILNGKKYDLELHLVMDDFYGKYTHVVLGVFFKAVPHGDNFFIQSMINANNQPSKVSLKYIFPTSELKDFYLYDGSLTIPNCNETTLWLVNANTFTVSPKQLEFFTNMWAGNQSFAQGRGNNRMVQPLNDRIVKLFHSLSMDIYMAGLLLLLLGF